MMKFVTAVLASSLFLSVTSISVYAGATTQAGIERSVKPMEQIKQQKLPIKLNQSIGKKVVARPVSQANARKIMLRRGSTFKEWSKNKVPNLRSYKTLLSVVSAPDREKVKKVIFISAGQQAANPKNPNELNKTYYGYPNVLTGQYRHYRKRCVDAMHCDAYIKPKSLADRIIDSGQFPASTTLMVLVFNSQFNHKVREGKKIKIENAFFDLLTSRFNANKVEQIALIGQSKGGCLAYSLGKRLRNDNSYKNIPLIVQGFDPVCKKNRLIAEGSPRFFSNPLVNKTKFKSRYINMDAVFPASNRQHLALLDIHSGAPSLIDGVHSFTYQANDIDLGWWKQAWVPYKHTPMGGELGYSKDTVIPGFNHLMKYTQQFASYTPPGGSTTVTNAQGCPKTFPKKVGVNGNKPVCVAHLPNKITEHKCKTRNSPGQVWSAKYCIWQKNNYWHARPLKVKQDKCPKKLARNVDTYNDKLVCMSVAPRKIKASECDGIKHGSNCIWNKGAYYKARPLKVKQDKCPKKLADIAGTYNGKLVCMSKAPRKIKASKCDGIKHESNCIWNKGAYYKARPLKLK